MNSGFSIMGIIGKFTPLNSGSLSAAISYNPNNTDYYDSNHISQANSRGAAVAALMGSALSLVSSESTISGAYSDEIIRQIKSKLPHKKGEYLFVVTIGVRREDNAPTRVMSVDRVYTATPKSKARFMGLVDKKCNSGKILCASISPLTKAMKNARVYVIASIK